MAEVQLLSLEEINGLEMQLLENEQAKEKNEPLPHVITKEQMRAVVMSLRAQRGTVRSAPGGAKKTKAGSIAIDLDGLMPK